jgi:cysteinyl-tRNA synthetase
MKLYNTLNRKVEEVKLQQPPDVSIYTCGPTVYDYPHIGNWFTFIRYDLLVRIFIAEQLHPRWVLNITDVGHLVSDADTGEDKLERGARREGKTAWEVAAFYTDYFIKGLSRLNITQPEVMPRATDHIKDQIEMIKQLEARGVTYIIDDGVYFDTSKFPQYADFARLDIDEQQTAARIEENPQKKQPTDFALWKFSPVESKRDMEWDSPWGRGFPGWHIECSAMVLKYLGETIDIHAGGIDHIPVHHTNEVAQSETATGKPLANYWMHTNHILIGNYKIAKSAGNVITLEDVEEKLNNTPEALQVFRLLVMQSHYRTQSQFDWDLLLQAKNRLFDLYTLGQLKYQTNLITARNSAFKVDDISNFQAQLLSAMENDLNTPKFLSELSRFTAELKNKTLFDQSAQETFGQLLVFIDQISGLDIAKQSDISAPEIEMFNEQNRLWLEAQNSHKDFTASDSIRTKLLSEHHIAVNNYMDRGPLWFRNFD